MFVRRQFVLCGWTDGRAEDDDEVTVYFFLCSAVSARIDLLLVYCFNKNQQKVKKLFKNISVFLICFV